MMEAANLTGHLRHFHLLHPPNPIWPQTFSETCGVSNPSSIRHVPTLCHLSSFTWIIVGVSKLVSTRLIWPLCHTQKSFRNEYMVMYLKKPFDDSYLLTGSDQLLARFIRFAVVQPLCLVLTSSFLARRLHGCHVSCAEFFSGALSSPRPFFLQDFIRTSPKSMYAWSSQSPQENLDNSWPFLDPHHKILLVSKDFLKSSFFAFNQLADHLTANTVPWSYLVEHLSEYL